MTRWRGLKAVAAAVVMGVAAVASVGRAADMPYETVAQYLLETVRAFRATYVLSVIEHTREGGIVPREDWMADSHAIPLPAQFVKAAGSEIESFEVGLIGLTPINRANLPKTQAEADALMKLATNRSQRLVTFAEGNQFKGLAADLAVVQSCVDCHNAHPKSPWRSFRKGDVMGAIVVRLNKK
ncbi:c-type heme family protein [Nitrospira sp. Kam-Ns4a]